MGYRISLAVFCLAVATPCIRANDDAREVVRRAVQAHGGEKNLAKTLTGRIKAEMSGELGEIRMRVQDEETFQLPPSYKRVVEGEVAGQKGRLEYAFTDGNGWLRRDGGPAQAFAGQKLPLERHWHTMPALLPGLLGAGYELSPIPGAQSDGRQVSGVRVKGEQGTVDLFFDASTGLLARSKRSMQLPLGNREVEGDIAYSDYKDVAGVKYPMKITVSAGGKKLIDVRVIEVQFLERVDPATFAKP
jgi:hypothetical protein